MAHKYDKFNEKTKTLANIELKNDYYSYLKDALCLCTKELKKGIQLAPEMPWYSPLPINSKVLPVYLFVMKIEDKLPSIPSYIKCLHLLETDSTTSKYLNKLVGNAYGASRVETKSLLQRLLSDYLTRVPDASMHEEVFIDLYSEQEQWLYSDNITFISLTPLINFQGDFETMELDTGLRFRAMNDEDKRKLGLLDIAANMQMDITVSKYAIEQTYMVSKDAEHSQVSSQSAARNEQILNLLTALRLFKPGIVGIKFTSTFNNQWSPDSSIVRTAPLHMPSYLGRNYSLESSEGDTFKHFYNEYLSFKKEGMAIALGRFNSYYDERSEEDRLIDALIAFENLLLPERDELGLRLALRSANLLGGGAKEKRRTFELLKKAYDLRSKIVHGSDYESTINLVDGDSLPIGEFVLRVEDYLREIIVAMLRRRQCQTKDKIIEEITNPF